MSQISEKTKFTYGVVMGVVGLCAWLTQIFAQGNANAKAIEELKVKQERLEEIATDVAVIKSQVSEIKAEVHIVRRAAE